MTYKNSTMSVLTGDNPFAKHKSNILDEQMIEENFLRFLSTTIKKIASKFKSLAFGQKIAMKISIPQNIDETVDDKQTGKSGGEYVEYIIIDRLYTYLSSHKFNELSISVDGSVVSKSQFERLLVERQKTVSAAAGTKQKNVKTWMKAGLAGAKDLFTQMKIYVDEAPMYKININAVGISLAGKEKADMIINIEKIDESEFDRIIKLSLKASLDEPWIFNGTQTSEENTMRQIITGFTATETRMNVKQDLGLDVLGQNVEELKAMAADDPELKPQLKDERRKFNAAKKIYKAIMDDSLMTAYNSIGMKSEVVEKMRADIAKIGENNHARGAFNKETKKFTAARNEIHKRLRAAKKAKEDVTQLQIEFDNAEQAVRERNKYKKVTWAQPIQLKQRDVIEVFNDVLETLKKKDKRQLIENLFKFAGVENGLDYLILGAKNKGNRKNPNIVGQSFINTLKKPEYLKRIEVVFEKLKQDSLDVEIKITSDASVQCSIMDGRKPVTIIPIEHHGNNMRVMGFELTKFYNEA